MGCALWEWHCENAHPENGSVRMRETIILYTKFHSENAHCENGSVRMRIPKMPSPKCHCKNAQDGTRKLEIKILVSAVRFGIGLPCASAVWGWMSSFAPNLGKPQSAGHKLSFSILLRCHRKRTSSYQTEPSSPNIKFRNKYPTQNSILSSIEIIHSTESILQPSWERFV